MKREAIKSPTLWQDLSIGGKLLLVLGVVVSPIVFFFHALYYGPGWRRLVLFLGAVAFVFSLGGSIQGHFALWGWFVVIVLLVALTVLVCHEPQDTHKR